jgi:chloride channel 3/4/5
MIMMACASELNVLQHIGNVLTRISRQNRWTSVLSLLIATVLRTFLVIISYGCKVPAGIFVPSMAIGASFGRMVGILVQAIQQAFPNSAFFSACQPDMPCITPGTYAFLGAAAALSGIMHITVSVVVIMFELTGALTYILPTMVSPCFFPHHSTTLIPSLRLS